VGALETKKQYLFSGNCLEKCEFPTALNSGHAHELDFAVSNRKEARVYCEAGKAQTVGNQPPKIAWLNQFNDDWSRFMYKSALDWKQNDYPDEVTNLLVDASDQGSVANGKWLSFLQFGEAWNM
jgi:hypothetical protein